MALGNLDVVDARRLRARNGGRGTPHQSQEIGAVRLDVLRNERIASSRGAHASYRQHHQEAERFHETILALARLSHAITRAQICPRMSRERHTSHGGTRPTGLAMRPSVLLSASMRFISSLLSE